VKKMSTATRAPSKNGHVTVAELAEAKCLPPEFLHDLGLRDLGRGGVAIPYHDATGLEIAIKRRTALKAKDGSYWPSGLAVVAYGQEHLDRARKVGFLILLEGESDCWVLWHHGLPGLGIPAANNAKALEAEHVECVERVYIVREPDSGGDRFVPGVVARLKQLGFNGRAYELRCPDGIKDLADLHVQDPGQFEARLEAAIEASVPLDIRDPEPGAHCTDLGNARRLVQHFGENLRHCHPWKKDLVWDGIRWRKDETALVERWAKETVRRMYEEAAAADDEKHRKALAAHASKSEDAKRLRAMASLARSEPNIPILPEILDNDRWLLNCPNGTLDLRTGQLREPRRLDYITRLCPTVYDPRAACPAFSLFLRAVFRDDLKLVQFVQRLLGHCLTGDIREQILPIFWGGGANGKSTLVNAFLETVGRDYAMRATADLLMERRGERHPTELADLFRMRLVITSETSQGRKLNEALVKDLTGGEPIRARRMKEDFWQFSPTHKVILLTNHKPVITGTDEGIWRRLRLVPFEVRFWDPNDPANHGRDLPPELRQDKELAAKLVAERPGILSWLVQGSLDWQQHGLTLPEKVRAATAAYRTSEDLLARFLEECCQSGADYRARASILYTAYRGWCEGGGEEPLSRQRFGEALTERNFERYTNNGTWYRGLAPRPEFQKPLKASEDPDRGTEGRNPRKDFSGLVCDTRAL
jgi:putative DNA primase/helicase